MTGSTLAVFCNGGQAGGGSGGITMAGAVTWTDIYAVDAGSTNIQTISGITTAISVTASLSSTGRLSYNLNGTFLTYTGAFAVHAGDQLAWTMGTDGVGSGNVSGVVTVTNATAAVTMGTFNYTVKDGRGM